MAYIERVRVYTDGCSKGNPGSGGIGVVIVDADGNILERFRESIGHCTNNEAEYRAVRKGLDLAVGQTRGSVEVFMDSELVARQLCGSYRIKAQHLLDLHDDVRRAELRFRSVVYNHRPRSHQWIREADKLANEAVNS